MENGQSTANKVTFLKNVLLKSKQLLNRKKKILFMYKERLREEQIKELREKLVVSNNLHENK